MLCVTLSEDDSHYPSTDLLFALLCMLAHETSDGLIKLSDGLSQALQGIVWEFGRQTLFALPNHRYTLLAIELILSFVPAALASGRMEAIAAIHGTLYHTILRDMAYKLKLDAAPTRLKDLLLFHEENSERLLVQTTYDCLQWLRIALAVAPNDQFEHYDYQSLSLTAATLLDIVPSSRFIPPGVRLAFYRVYGQIREHVAVSDLIANMKDLNALALVIEEHHVWCKQTNDQVKEFSSEQIDDSEHRYTLVDARMMEHELHFSRLKVRAFAMFLALVSTASPRQTGTEIQPEQTVDVSNQIIDRFAEPTRSSYAGDICNDFLIKYGSSRMDYSERALATFVQHTDSLTLNQIPFYAPPREAVANTMWLCKDLVEQNAARMKGWGVLHDRVDTQLILLRACASTLDSIASSTHGTVERGSLWAFGAKVVRSLHGLMSKWKEWTALGRVTGRKFSTLHPSHTPEIDGVLTSELCAELEEWLRSEGINFDLPVT